MEYANWCIPVCAILKSVSDSVDSDTQLERGNRTGHSSGNSLLDGLFGSHPFVLDDIIPVLVPFPSCLRNLTPTSVILPSEATRHLPSHLKLAGVVSEQIERSMQ